MNRMYAALCIQIKKLYQFGNEKRIYCDQPYIQNYFFYNLTAKLNNIKQINMMHFCMKRESLRFFIGSSFESNVPAASLRSAVAHAFLNANRVPVVIKSQFGVL